MLVAEESSQRWPTNTEKCTLTQNDNRASANSSETDERDSDEYDRRDVTDERTSDVIDSGRKDDSSDVILAFINSDQEDAKRHALKASHN